MTHHLQAWLQGWRKLAALGATGIALALCGAPLHASTAPHRAAHETARRPLHPVYRAKVRRVAVHPYARREARAPERRPALRNASYKKAPVRRRIIRYRRRIIYRRRWHYRHRMTLPRAPSRDRTEQIQSALARGGYYSGDPNGRWDGETEEALRRFQAANELPPTGKLDALSLQKMGLGSDVAGVSAPRPIQSSNQLPSPSPSSPAPKTPGL